MKMFSVVVLLMVCSVASSSELRLRCPEPTADSPMAVYNMAWLCDLFKWRESIADFKKRFESECNVTDVETQWQEMYECPDFSNITCKQESSLTNKTDSFNCSILFCKDGHYEDEDALPGIWRQHFHFHRTVMNFSDSINCTRECPVTETPVEGPSCAKLGKCCTGIDDLCLISDNGTTCHCDENCIHNQDCCSDYELICKGETSTQEYEDTATAEDLAAATAQAVVDEYATTQVNTPLLTNETRNATQAAVEEATTQVTTADPLAIAACNGGTYIVDELSGTISSPNYPDNYPNNAQCSWNISVPDGMVITVQSGWTYDIEYCGAASDFDYLQFNYGQKYCGKNSNNPSFQTTGNFLIVLFISDGSETGSGFSFNWVASTPAASVEDTTAAVDEGSSSTDSTVAAIEDISTEHNDYGDAVTNGYSDYGHTNDQSTTPEAETTPTAYDYGATEY